MCARSSRPTHAHTLPLALSSLSILTLNVAGVDMSDIIDDAREIVKANGFEDKIVLLKGKVCPP